jgi:multiple sugar transport system permease protein
MHKLQLSLFLALCVLIPTFLCFVSFYMFRGKRKPALVLLVVSLIAGVFLFLLTGPTFAFWKANDPRFWQYCWNTLFLMLAIPISIFSSLLLAIVMNQKLRGIYLLRLIYYLPTICTGVGIYLLWMWIYNPDYGPINIMISKLFHVSGPQWLMDMTWAKPALMLMGFWSAVGGFNCVLYLAALQGIPQELYEASEIDGASWWQKFWAIIWPLVSPTTFYIFIMSIIGGFQAGFDMAYVMTGGGPAGSTTTIAFYIYDQAFRNFEFGYACAIAWILFVLVFGVTVLNYRIGGKVVHY